MSINVLIIFLRPRRHSCRKAKVIHTDDFFFGVLPVSQKIPHPVTVTLLFFLLLPLSQDWPTTNGKCDASSI
jgi:hypothetical protein